MKYRWAGMVVIPLGGISASCWPGAEYRVEFASHSKIAVEFVGDSKIALFLQASWLGYPEGGTSTIPVGRSQAISAGGIPRRSTAETFFPHMLSLYFLPPFDRFSLCWNWRYSRPSLSAGFHSCRTGRASKRLVSARKK